MDKRLQSLKDEFGIDFQERPWYRDQMVTAIANKDQSIWQAYIPPNIDARTIDLASIAGITLIKQTKSELIFILVK